EKNKDLSSKINDNGTIDLDDDFINKVNNYKSGLDSGTEQILINNYIWPLYFQYDNNFNFNSNKPPQIKLSNILTKGHYKLSATVEITDYCYDYNFTSANFGISIMYSDSYSKLQTSYSKFYPINLNYKANTYRNFTYYIETDDLYFDGSKLYYGATSLDTNGIIYVRAYMEKSKIYNCKIKDMTFFRNKTMVKGQHYFIDNNKSIENLDRGYYKAIVENQEDLLAVNN
ncbi:MAG: hypothetical protein N2486_10810, partial [Caloramator sp.]|nr:hypothetical protein [Caloramator sp.]